MARIALVMVYSLLMVVSRIMVFANYKRSLGVFLAIAVLVIPMACAAQPEPAANHRWLNVSAGVSPLPPPFSLSGGFSYQFRSKLDGQIGLNGSIVSTNGMAALHAGVGKAGYQGHGVFAAFIGPAIIGGEDDNGDSVNPFGASLTRSAPQEYTLTTNSVPRGCSALPSQLRHRLCRAEEIEFVLTPGHPRR